MGIRGPKSQAELSVVPIGEQRVRPYKSLPDAVKKLWSELVETLPANRFVASDRPLLRMYCRAVHLAELAFSEFARQKPETMSQALKAAEGMSKLAANVATKLRLTPQSRLDRKTAGSDARNNYAIAPGEE